LPDINDVRDRLAHVLWIGGGTDSGKTSVATWLAQTGRMPVYHYDQADLRHHQRLATTSTSYAAFLKASMDERWVHREPVELTERSWQTFSDRFPLVVEDLTTLSFPAGMRVIAEGFGLTPALLDPVLQRRTQAIWLLPTDEFKLASMQRRGKGQFGGLVSDTERATRNLRERDRLLAERIRRDAEARQFAVIEVDGTEPIEAIAGRVARHFAGL
jgi:hypothetical protein